MSIALESLNHKVQRAAVGTMVDVALAHVSKDRQKRLPRWWTSQSSSMATRSARRRMSTPAQVLTDADSKWSKLINCVLDQTAPRRGTHHGAQPWL